MIVVIYLLVLVAAFFFLIVLPQRRRMQGHRALMAALQVGDEVVNTGGIHGRIRSLDDEIVELEIATGVVVKVARGAISARVAPPATDDTEAT
jgi:preprotein translocase subunit YajC